MGAVLLTISRVIRGLVFILLAAALAACSARRPEGDVADVTQLGRYAIEQDYRIGIDDRIQVSVWKNPELSITAPVRPDGRISVPLIGDVVAGGKTPPELADAIREKLAAYIRDPNVTVIVTDLQSHEFLTRVRVTGAVRNPRSLPFRQGMTVLDAVLEAGGLNDFAAPNRTKLYRTGKSGTQVYDVALGDILNSGKLDTNYTLFPRDVLTIPERLF